jgi:ligand-binding sensor domain-containing protein
MNSKILSFLLFLVLLSGSSDLLTGQGDFRIKSYSQDNGLAHNFIQSIAQDNTGFLWIATWDGLSRYDGIEFKNYYHKPNDTTSFSFFVVDKIVVDKINNVWILCQGRQPVVYNRANDCFDRFYFSSAFGSRLNDITVGRDSSLWLTFRTVLYNYNVVNKQIKTYNIVCDNNSIAVSDNNSAQIAIDNNGGIWLYYWVNNEYHIFKGIVLDDSTLHLSDFGTINLDKYESSTFHNNTGNFDLYISETGKTWLFSKYGLFYLDTLNNYFVENKAVIDPSEFKGKNYYIWTQDNSGIHIINTSDRSLINIKPENKKFIESVFVDKNGTIWFGDINQSRENVGLKKYLKIPSYFRHFLTGKNENNSSNLVFPIVEDNNKDLLVGARYLDYLFRIKPDGTQERQSFSEGYNNPEHSTAISMVKDSSGVWIGTTTGKLIYLDFQTKKAKVRFPLNENDTIKSISAHNIIKSRNRIILNGGKGIYGFIPETNGIVFYYKHRFEGTEHTLVKDGNDGFWLGTEGNTIIHFDRNLKMTSQFKFGTDNNIVEHICVGDSNDIWTALMGGGIGHLYPETGKMELYTTADGLSNNVTYSILKDSGGNLWISTNNGLSRLNPHTRHFTNFGKSEGVLISEFNSDSYFQADDGEMFFGGVGGMIGFYPDSINNYRTKYTADPIIITDFSVSGINRYFRKAIYELDTITLEKGDNNFQLTYACLNFQISEKIKYRYRLLGENNDWIETDYRNRKINFANLTHKDYQLEIESSDESGDWVNKFSILIRIPHKLFETMLARSFILILILSGSFFLFFYYIKSLKLKAKQVQDKLRMESLRGQMNPHFIFNSLNSINYFISKEDKLSANHYIADFSRLIRAILSNLSSDYIPLKNEIESIQDYLKLEYLRFGDKFNYIISTDKIGNIDEVSVFPGLVQPFIENAIWHGVRGLEQRVGLIRIEFNLVSQVKVQCLIEDDGIGRKLAHQFRNELPGHKSCGIDIVLERLKIISNISKENYNVLIEDLYMGVEETGTRVIVDLPVKKTLILNKD